MIFFHCCSLASGSFLTGMTMQGDRMSGKLRNMASIYIIDNNQFLMLYRIGSRVVPPSWCGVGGHFEQHELNDAKACVLREMEEEIGLTESDIKNIHLRYITLRLKNGELRQNYYFFADLEEGTHVSLVCDEGKLEWVPVSKVMDLEMPFTARYVLEHYMETGCSTKSLYGGCADENGVHFVELSEF